jgi:hypothetical protein
MAATPNSNYSSSPSPSPSTHIPAEWETRSHSRVCPIGENTHTSLFRSPSPPPATQSTPKWNKAMASTGGRMHTPGSPTPDHFFTTTPSLSPSPSPTHTRSPSPNPNKGKSWWPAAAYDPVPEFKRPTPPELPFIELIKPPSPSPEESDTYTYAFWSHFEQLRREDDAMRRFEEERRKNNPKIEQALKNLSITVETPMNNDVDSLPKCYTLVFKKKSDSSEPVNPDTPVENSSDEKPDSSEPVIPEPRVKNSSDEKPDSSEPVIPEPPVKNSSNQKRHKKMLDIAKKLEPKSVAFAWMFMGIYVRKSPVAETLKTGFNLKPSLEDVFEIESEIQIEFGKAMTGLINHGGYYKDDRNNFCFVNFMRDMMEIPELAMIRMRRVLTECKCCELHQSRRPLCQEKKREPDYDMFADSENDCKCSCRHFMRKLESALQGDYPLEVNGQLWERSL